MTILHARFKVVAQASPSPTYQWYLGDQEDPDDRELLPGKTSPILNLSSLEDPVYDGAHYSCKITNHLGSVWSRRALLTVLGAPVFTLMPQSQEVVPDATLSLTVATTGSPTPTYEWFKDDVLLTDGGRISGATTTNLQITNFESGDAGTYKCVATNTYGSATSDNAIITEGVPPPPDNIWVRSFGYTLDVDDNLVTVDESNASPFYPYVNNRRTIGAGAFTLQFDYNVLFNGGSDSWSLVRGVAIADYSSFKKDKSFNQIMNSTIGAFAGFSTGEFGWTYFTCGAPEAIENPYAENGVWGNPLHGTTIFEVSALKMNGMRDIHVHVIGFNAIDDVIFDLEFDLTDRITGSDILVMVAGAADTYWSDGSFDGSLIYS